LIRFLRYPRIQVSLGYLLGYDFFRLAPESFEEREHDIIR